MNRLKWIEKDGTWRAGRYRIEAGSSGAWRLSVEGIEKSPGDEQLVVVEFSEVPPSVEDSSASLWQIKATAEKLERLRIRRQRRSIYLVAAVVSMVGLIWVATSDPPWAPVIILISATIAIWSLLRLIDLAVSRSWESLSNVYQ